jgi:hypothetical protein
VDRHEAVLFLASSAAPLPFHPIVPKFGCALSVMLATAWVRRNRYFI